jgi:chemotaxis protein methyltransferase CheR
LQWALPYLHMRWAGFRQVRGQVCKRIGRRLEELHLPDLKSYRQYLENNPLEWHILDTMCRITISRFYRDKRVFDLLSSHVFPEVIATALRQGDRSLSCWCIGSASGEEPYTVSLFWEFSEIDTQKLPLEILATEIDQALLNRARSACYPASSIRDLPADITSRAFTRTNGLFCLKEQFRKRVKFLQQDIRNIQPDSQFHLIFCRNLVLTYFSLDLQEKILKEIFLRLKPAGSLIIGAHENIPASLPGLVPWFPGKTSCYKKF